MYVKAFILDKEWTLPSFKKRVQLSSGPAVITVSFGVDTVDAKMRCCGFVVKDTDTNEPLTMSIQCRTTYVNIELARKTKSNKSKKKTKGSKKAVSWIARACCKPPDVFEQREGIKAALRRLIHMDNRRRSNSGERKGYLSRNDQSVIWEAFDIDVRELRLTIPLPHTRSLAELVDEDRGEFNLTGSERYAPQQAY